MEYKITHSTTYDYSQPVSVCHNVVMLSPQTFGLVTCHSHRLIIRPTPSISSTRLDFFGNVVHAFSIEENHRQLSITATSRVSVSPATDVEGVTTSPWKVVADGVAQQAIGDWLDLAPFAYDSPRIRCGNRYLEYAAESFVKDRPILEAARELNHRIFTDFKYDKDATDVHTTTAEAFRMRKGVCQDFAHILIACLRSLALPARYVSGYLRTIPPVGRPRFIGADQSHAWVALYCGPELGWVDFDPTNDCICSADHIPVALGRDYSDVVPLKGVFLGGGEHRLSVSVDVAPQADSIPTDY